MSMKKNLFKLCKEDKTKKQMKCGCGGGAYFLGFIGAAIYFIQNSTTFWQGVVGFLKALVWPVFLVHKLFEL